MPAPTAYTEDGLATFMANELGATGVALGLSDSTPAIEQAVYATERLLGVSDIANATDVALVEAGARWQAWLAARAVAAGRFDIKAGSVTVTQSQVFEQITAMLATVQDAWYTAQATSQAAAGTWPFVFGVACGGRGR